MGPRAAVSQIASQVPDFCHVYGDSATVLPIWRQSLETASEGVSHGMLSVERLHSQAPGALVDRIFAARTSIVARCLRSTLPSYTPVLHSVHWEDVLLGR